MSGLVLEREIQEQPAALRRLIDAEAEHVLELGRRLAAADVRYVVLAARGSSDNAARYAQHLLGGHAGLPVALATPSLFTLYESPPRLDGALVVGISQSGASPDIVAVLDEARRQGRPTLALTNDVGSPLARAADDVVDLHAGREEAVAATKTYTTSLAALALLALGLAGEGPVRPALPGPGTAGLEALRSVPAAFAAQLEQSAADVEALDRYAEREAVVVVGRGATYGSAFEAALKIRELTGITAEAWSAPDLLHGPIAAVGPGLPALVLAPRGPVLGGLRELSEALRDRGAELVAVSDDDVLLESADVALPLVGGLPDWLAPFTAIVPAQLAALRLARLRGVDVDHPLGLTKVTRTR